MLMSLETRIGFLSQLIHITMAVSTKIPNNGNLESLVEAECSFMRPKQYKLGMEMLLKDSFMQPQRSVPKRKDSL
jgi:hypothetical protein